MLLADLTAAARRVALVGLAKNTGKTVALAALLGELRTAGHSVGVTSVGRDGEEHDVIDARIEKPAVSLWAGCLVATTDELLRASGIPHEVLERTDVRTPLGHVLIARMKGAGAIEVAGPSASADVRAVSDSMLARGASQVLIDGAIDRRAASSPEVSDALLMCTGAVLSVDIEEVVTRTAEAVELVRLQTVSADGAGVRLRALAGAALLVEADLSTSELAPRFVLSASGADVASMLDAHPRARWLLVPGALPEAFVRDLALAARPRSRALELVVADSTRVFLSERGPQWYERQGVSIRVLQPIALRAITVNPVAPQSHSFLSGELRARLARAIGEVPILDVLDSAYAGARDPLAAARGRPGD